MEQTRIRRYPDIARNIRVNNYLYRRRSRPKSTCGSERLAACGRDIELRGGGTIKYRVVPLVGGDNGVRRKGGDSGEAAGVLGDHDAVARCGPPQYGVYNAIVFSATTLVYHYILRDTLTSVSAQSNLPAVGSSGTSIVNIPEDGTLSILDH